VPTFKAIVVEKSDGGQKVRLTDFDEANLMEGDVTVRVEWSTVNYKDGLAITGKAPVVRRFPMIAGIDFAGTVESSTHPQWKPGDRVILNGWGLGETHLGGYAEKARVKGNWLVRLPARNSARGAMAIGTAGFTAMLAVMALERHGVTPRHGPVIVTGAAGGLGSVAVTLLAMLAVMALERHGVTPRHGPVIVTGAAGGLGSVAVTLLAKLGFAVIASGRGYDHGAILLQVSPDHSVVAGTRRPICFVAVAAQRGIGRHEGKWCAAAFDSAGSHRVLTFSRTPISPVSSSVK